MSIEVENFNGMYYIVLFIVLPFSQGNTVLEEFNGCSVHRTQSCALNAICTDNLETQTWACACPPGMSGDGYIKDGPENSGCGKPRCTFDTDCHDYAECDDMAECTCHQGYHGDGIDECTDTNECNYNPCHLHARCVNTEGSFKCVCDVQNNYFGDGFNCSHRCSVPLECEPSEDCINEVCVCRAGYLLDASGICRDIDECSSTNECDPNADCINEEGGYSCLCINGYEGDGKTCTRIPTKCQDILDDDASARSGTYPIDPDGTGPQNTTSVWCEMRTGLGITVFETLRSYSSFTRWRYTYNVGYKNPIHAIKAVAESSVYCAQDLRFLGRRGAILLADKNDHWVDGNGNIHTTWGGSTVDGKCACGELGYCQVRSSPCNCDGSSTKNCWDDGKITNKSTLPTTSVTIKPTNGWGFGWVKDVKCAEKVFDVPKNCHDAKFNPYTSIKYDGPQRLDFSDSDQLETVLAYCDMTSYDHAGVTVMPVQNSHSTNFTTNGTKYVHYTVAAAQVKQLVNTSQYCGQYLSYKCKNSPQTINGVRKIYFSDTDGDAKDYWAGGLNLENQCACGVVEICDDETKGCNCDAQDDEEHEDFGWVYNKDDLPIGAVTVIEIGDGSFGEYTVGPLMCSEYEFGIPPTCQEIAEKGIHGSHVFMIDPDGPVIPKYNSRANEPAFPVYCDISKDPPYATTTVYHNHRWTFSASLHVQLNYTRVTNNQLTQLVKRSVYCSQEVSIACFEAQLHGENSYARWSTRDGRQLTYFAGDGTDANACACEQEGSCPTGYSCNCDVGDAMSRMDFGVLSKKEDLPMMSLDYDLNGTSSEANISLGPLMCREIFPSCGDRKSHNHHYRTAAEVPMKNGHYPIDPDGYGGVSVFVAECIGMRSAIGTYIVNGSETQGSPDDGVARCYKVSYQVKGVPVSPAQIQALIAISNNCGQQMSQTCLNANLTGHSNFSTCDGKAQQGWAGSNGAPTCACGVTAGCAHGPESKCNCDAENGKKYQDGAWILTKTRLAVCEVCVSLDPTSSLKLQNKTRSVQPFVSDLFCDFGRINGAKTCQDLRNSGITETGTHTVQVTSTSNAFPIHCVMHAYPPYGIMAIYPKEPLIIIPPVGIEVTIEYFTYSFEAMISIIAEAGYCTQEMYIHCNDSRLEWGGEYGWTSKNGELQVAWAGNYEGTATCAGGHCSCNDGGRQQDGGVIIDSDKIPAIKVKLGPAPGNRTLSVGPVKCYNLRKTCDEIKRKREKTNPMGNGTYAIDSDQSGPLEPMAVSCDFKSCRRYGLTEVKVNQGASGWVNGYGPPNSFQRDMTYTSSYDQINALAQASQFCLQTAQFLCVKTPLIKSESMRYGGYDTYGGQPSTSWGVGMDSNIVGCACAATGTCPANSKCHCDGTGYLKADYGFETNRSRIPITEVSFGQQLHPHSTAMYSVSNVWCGPRPCYLPPDCDDAYKRGYRSGEILIWPSSRVDPFLVYCDMDNLVKGRGVSIAIPKTSGQNVTYGSQMYIEYNAASHEQLYRLAKFSAYCYQPFKYICWNTKFLSLDKFTWQGATSSYHYKYVGNGRPDFQECNCGAQGENGLCGGSESRETLMALKRPCNCDACDNETRADAGVFQNKASLPMRNLHFDETGIGGSYGFAIVGNLYCSPVPLDLNECKLGFHDCHKNAKCINQPSGYDCYCRAGYRGLGRPDVWANGRNCYDDNECALFMCPDSAICTNLPGNYDCKCKDGYDQLSKHRCKDIDECALGTHNCSENARCINLPGSYVCRCNYNYRGDGFTCEPLATCSCFGDPHCISLDGKLIDYQGLCQYVMSRDRCDQLDQEPTYKLQTSFSRRNVRTFADVSWVKEVTFIFEQYIIKLMQGWEVRVNGYTVHLPYTRHDLSIRRGGYYVVVKTSLGIEVSWDGHEAVQLRTPGQWRNQTCGLCGNYNNDPTDDMIVGPGCVEEEGNLTDSFDVFGDSWVTDESVEAVPECASNCTNTGDNHECTGVQYELAKLHCEIVFDRNGKFRSCLLEMGIVLVDMLFRSCIYDLCHIDEDPGDAICDAAESLVEKCQLSNIPVENFRTPDFCPITCPDKMEYKPCQYKEQIACADYINGNSPDTLLVCQEGCFCKAGFVFDVDKCVPTEDCGCIYNDTYYQLEEVVPLVGCNREAVCTRGNNMTEQGLVCHVNATCKLKGGRYGCHCDDGLFGDGINVCIEDRCRENPCGENETCLRNPDKPEGYECRCVEGFSGDCNNCTEIDECASYEKLCPTFSDCINTIGSYRCECHDGYTLLHGACKDVDECDLAKRQNTTACGENSKCQNKMGKFECVCCNGFQDDGNGTCVEITDEEGSENGTKCCICEMGICERKGPVCGKDFMEYNSVKDLIISNCEKGLSPEWYEAVDYYSHCRGSCPKNSLCPKWQDCVTDDETGLPTCICPPCTEEEMKSEKVCTNKLDIYENLCEFKQMQCLLDHEAVPLPTFEPCEGKNGGSGPVSDWSPWSPCSVTCGKGTSERSRIAYKELSVAEQAKYPLSLPTECYEEPCPESSCLGHICGYIFAECVENAAGNPVCECPTCTNIGHEPVCGFVQLPIGRIATSEHRSACHLKKLACENKYHDAGVINEGHCDLTPVHCTRVPENAQYVRGGPNNTYVSDVKLQGFGCLGGCDNIKQECCRPVETAAVPVELFNQSDRSQTMTIQVEVVKDCDCVDLDDIEAA